MKQYFRTPQSVLSSRWGDIRPVQAEVEKKTDRVLRSTKPEDCIYRDLREADDTMQTVNAECSRKLHSFPALSQDIFQSFYSLFPKRNAPETLTLEAQKFNSKILDRVIENSDYAAMKSICEGRELPEDYLETLRKEQLTRKFTVTGILLDADSPGMTFSLMPFCQKVYRTSEWAGDAIVRDVIKARF